MRNLKTAISIPEDIFLQAEDTARVLGLNRSRLYTTAIAEFLEKYRDTNLKAKLDAVYNKANSQIDLSIVKAQAASIPREDW